MPSNLTNTNIQTENKTYNAIDFAKFICSILVVMIHVPLFGEQNSTNIFTYLNFLFKDGICRMAVPLFFMFSGFLLYKKTKLDNFSTQHVKKYILNIFKLYIIWSIIYIPLSFMDILAEHKTLSVGILIYIKNFFLKGSYTHLWYLNALCVAVIIVSFLLYKKISPKRILIISSFFYVIGLLGSGYEGIITPLYSIPIIGNLINWYFYIFSVTRNGLFFAFFFVALGMFLSNKTITISSKKSLLLFIISTILMCTETVILKTFNIAKTYDILIFSIPTALFGFLFLLTLNLKDKPIYKKLRELSALIYYTHYYAYYFVLISISLFPLAPKGFLLFAMVLLLTITISYLIIKINKKKIKFY